MGPAEPPAPYSQLDCPSASTMLDNSAAVSARLEALVGAGNELTTSNIDNDAWGTAAWIGDAVGLGKWRAQCRAALGSLGSPAKTYLLDFDSVESKGLTNNIDDVKRQLGTMLAVLEDLRSGYLTATLRTLIESEFLTNLSDQADVLLKGGYIAAATSIAGAELEQGLRAIARARGVTVTQRDEIAALTTKLAQGGFLTSLQQKQIATWKELRNLADHGRHDKLTLQAVEQFLSGSRRFLTDML
jgi:hypothetical protein